MKRVYLDWGVVSNMKKPEYAEIKDFLLANKGNLFFVYSTAHFEDAMRSRGDERLMQDIQLLESLVDNHLLAFDKKTAHPYLATPTEYYQKHNKKLMNAGELKPKRVELFKQLLELGEKYKHVNQYQ